MKYWLCCPTVKLLLLNPCLESSCNAVALRVTSVTLDMCYSCVIGCFGCLFCPSDMHILCLEFKEVISFPCNLVDLTNSYPQLQLPFKSKLE